MIYKFTDKELIIMLLLHVPVKLSCDKQDEGRTKYEQVKATTGERQHIIQ